MKLVRLLPLFAGLLGFGTASAAAEELRTALVMGVADYGSHGTLPALPGIGQDLAAISASLRELGFEVTVVQNPTLARAEQAVDDFGARLRARHGVGLYYFAGYARQWNGTNYLLPKGAHIGRSRDLPHQALPATRILNRMEETGAPVNLVFLDCCQDTPVGSDRARLAEMKASGVFVGFSMVSRNVARAATEGSLYTRALVDHLTTPGLSIVDMHTLVAANVCSVAANQTPGQYSGLTAPFYLWPAIDSEPNLAPNWTYDFHLGRWFYRDPAEEKARLNACASLEIPFAIFHESPGCLALNLYSQKSQTNARTFDRVIKEGNYAVGGHGTPDYIQDDRGQVKDRAGRKIYPKELADEIRSDPNYNPGNPVTLYACSTGRGANSFAQKLADELGAPVMAPDDVLWSGARGPDFVGPWKGNHRTVKDYAHRHGFKYFQPRP